MRRLAIAALTPALAAATPVVPALADSGVHVDPRSPAGKEYALPLDQAKRDAGGESGQTGSSGSTSGRSALFGEGIKPARHAAARAKAKGSAEGKSGQGSGGKAGAAARLSATTGTTGDSPLLVDGGIALAVLLAAGAFALALRRVLR
jgi:hypothetical protein